MKFAILGEHRKHFDQNKMIAFEELLTEEQLQELSGAMHYALAKRLKIAESSVIYQPPEQLCRMGRDLWRSHDPVAKVTKNRQFAKLMGDLIDAKVIRLGYDQLLPSAQTFLKGEVTLQSISCIQGVVGGLMLCLTGEGEGDGVFSGRAGSGVFFAPDCPIDFSYMQRHPEESYFMIVYSDQKAVYVVNREDPLGHQLMNQGYSSGDRLSDSLNPILID